MEQEAIYVGIDVAKDRVDVALRPSGDVWGVAYGESGVSGLVSRLQALKPSAVVLEATGGLEIPLAAALAAASLPVAVVNPGRGATSPKPPAGWPRPMRWTPGFWPISPRRFVRRFVPCRTQTPRNSIPLPLGATRW